MRHSIISPIFVKQIFTRRKSTKWRLADRNSSLTSAFIGEKPPREIPPHFLNDFTMNGKVKLEKFYIDESAAGKGTFVRFSQSDIQGYLSKARLSKSIASSSKSSQYSTDTWFFQALKEYPIEGQDIAIIGSQAPWFESICIANGASLVTTIEYNKLQYEHQQMKTMTVNQFLESPKKFDSVIAVSCIEHGLLFYRIAKPKDGLGRYGDPVDPFADIKSMEFLKCILKEGGKLYLGVPIGPDAVTWNMGRRYGNIRLPILLKGWKVLNRIGWNPEALQKEASTKQLYVPIQILEPE